MSENIVSSIYILTNPSFQDYVKIGYSKNVSERINKLNNSEAVPFGFRLYATYDVETQSADKVLHKIIDKLNADLRSIDTINDKVRVREFYLISPEDAYELLEDISIISGTKERLHLYKPTKDEVQEEETNNEVPNNSSPSKKQILLQAVKDLNGEVESNITLYQLQHRLEKILSKD